jgi:hypothetical protein
MKCGHLPRCCDNHREGAEQGHQNALDNVQKHVEDMQDVFGTRYSNRISRHDVWLLIEKLRRP